MEKQQSQHSVNRISRRDILVTSTSVLAAASLTNSALITPAQAQSNAPVPTPTFSSEALTQRTAERRALEAAI
jgi:hypothetical protein